MALKVEVIVDAGMDAEEALGGSSRLEALHLPSRRRTAWCEFSARLFLLSPCS
jgi:hypothetical protein